MNPVALPLWAAGLYFLLFGWSPRSFRPLGLAFLVVLALCLITRAKSYFLAPAYPALLAAGGVLLADTRAAVRWLVVGPYAVLLAVSGVPMAIAAAPILPPDTTARVLAIMRPERLRQERNATAELPQYLADRYGWEEMVATVASVYHGLSPEEQREACILVGNYGRAAAIDFYGPRHGLPPAISGHNNYYLWGHRDCTGRVVITTGQSDRALRGVLRRVDRVATVTCAYCMPSENDLPVWIARGATRPMATIWPSLKHLLVRWGASTGPPKPRRSGHLGEARAPVDPPALVAPRRSRGASRYSAGWGVGTGGSRRPDEASSAAGQSSCSMMTTSTQRPSSKPCSRYTPTREKPRRS